MSSENTIRENRSSLSCFFHCGGALSLNKTFFPLLFLVEISIVISSYFLGIDVATIMIGISFFSFALFFWFDFSFISTLFGLIILLSIFDLMFIGLPLSKTITVIIHTCVIMIVASYLIRKIYLGFKFKVHYSSSSIYLVLMLSWIYLAAFLSSNILPSVQSSIALTGVIWLQFLLFRDYIEKIGGLLRKYFLLMSGIGFSTAFIGFLLYFTGPIVIGRISVQNFGSLHGLPVISSFFQNPNTTGLIYVISFPITLYLFFNENNPLMKAFLTFALITISFGILLTFSRSTYMGVTIASGLMLYQRSKRIFAFIFGASILVFIVLPNLPLGFILAKKGPQFRWILWIAGLNLVRHNLLLGLGFGKGVINTLGKQSIALGLPHHFMGLSAHNSYLMLALESGLPAVIFFSLFIFSYYQKVFHSLKIARKDERNQINFALMAVITGILMQQFFEAFMFKGIKFVDMQFWALIGISLSICRSISKDYKRGSI